MVVMADDNEMLPVAPFDASTASRFARIALANVVREYPNKPDHVLESMLDAQAPSAMHPAFHGAYDWHSCVHMHWLMARVRNRFPDLPEASAIGAVFDQHLTPAAIAGEVAYLRRPASASFERTYGWAWLLKLAQELATGNDTWSARWAAALQPLADAFTERYLDYLPRAEYPLRYGVHNNSAFGVLFALEYARCCDRTDLASLCERTAVRWFEADRNAPADWEPSGADFLSPSLVEASLMHRVLEPRGFATWLDAFLPGLADGKPRSLFTPANVCDRSDPQIVHLDGLNLSRAWCFGSIALALAPEDARRDRLLDAAERHLRAGLVGLASGDYLGEHWLASFAALALTR